MIISAIDDSPMPDREALLAALRREYGVGRVELAEPRSAAFDLNVAPDGDPPFRVTALDAGTLSTDGTPDQNAAVAVIVRDLLPDESPRIVAIDPQRDAYVDLVAGITATRVASGWRHISEGGFGPPSNVR